MMRYRYIVSCSFVDISLSNYSGYIHNPSTCGAACYYLLLPLGLLPESAQIKILYSCMQRFHNCTTLIILSFFYHRTSQDEDEDGEKKVKREGKEGWKG